MDSKDFIHHLKFQNTLPDAPCGPFLKKIVLFNKFENFSNFQLSTLEKSYVWQPHFGFDMGINLDLVDQESLLRDPQLKINQNALDPEEVKYLSGQISEKQKTNTKKMEEKDKPWWLRTTNYFENDLFKKSKVKGLEDLNHEYSKNKKKMNGESNQVDYFSVDAINKSFNNVDETVKSLIASRKTKSSILYSLPLLPDETHFEKENSYALTKFHEDPMSNEEIPTDESDKPERVFKSIITNIRLPTSKEEMAIKTNEFEVSMVVSNHQENGKHLLESHFKDSEINHKRVKYEWLKDYKMEIRDDNVQDAYVFSIISSSNGSDDGKVYYNTLSTHIEMRKMNVDESIPHTAYVQHVNE